MVMWHHWCAGVLPGHTWELGTPYTFNVSLVDTNASGAHFAGFIQNNRSGEVLKLGEIFTRMPPAKVSQTNKTNEQTARYPRWYIW